MQDINTLNTRRTHKVTHGNPFSFVLGLLAGLWEFPSIQVTPNTEKDEYWPVVDQHLSSNFNLDKNKTTERKYVDEVK